MSKPKSKTHRANQAILRGANISPRKARIVIDMVRDRPVDEALSLLKFTPKKASPMVAKLIESAIHNIMNSEELDWDTDDLVVARAFVDEGKTLRRFQPRAMGRATRINKRTSQITVVLQPRA
ncbi:MAG: 50S ribosomal protein L22 [Bradymonadaceae bacterium]